MKFTPLLIASTLSAMVLATPLQASEGHAGESHSTMSQNPGVSGMFLEKRDIDGYSVSFHVMEAAERMRPGGSHNLMVKVEKDNTAISELQANSKVVYPDGKEESKSLMKMGDWYMAGYDLKDTGKHQVMVLFKTSDGKKHFGGVHYTK
ncbi:MAG: hypothetical protein V7739_15520 [Motiliproteus sp.]